MAGGGPTRVTFNEFTPLFQRNQAQLLATLLAGNNNTFGNEAIVSGLYNNIAISAGQLHSQTDGFRENNDVNNNLYNLFAQVDVTPTLSLQTEVRHRDTREGDLVLNFDPDDFSSKFQRRVDQDIFRLGTRLILPAVNVIASLLYTDREENFRNLFESLPEDLRLDEAKDIKKGAKPEVRAIFESTRFNSTVGAGFYNVDIDQDFFGDRTSDSIRQATAYTYTNLLFPAGFLPTFGLSYDFMKRVFTSSTE